MTLRRRQAIAGLLLVSPWVVGFVLLKLLPILASLGLSFTDFYLLTPEETKFVGAANYLHLLSDQDAAFAFLATVSQALQLVPLQLLASLGLASLLNAERLRARTVLRTLFFLPSIIPAVAIFSMWIGFLDPTTGWLNRLLLQPLGLPPFSGFQSEASYNLLQEILALWSIGPGMLIMLGALQSIPQELYESARVDGAGPLLRFAKLTVPLISPAILFSLVIDLIGVFGGVALLDRGNPISGSSSLFDGYIYQVLFHSNEMGYAAALSWMFFLLMLGVALLIFRTSSRWVFYMDGGPE